MPVGLVLSRADELRSRGMGPQVYVRSRPLRGAERNSESGEDSDTAEMVVAFVLGNGGAGYSVKWRDSLFRATLHTMPLAAPTNLRTMRHLQNLHQSHGSSSRYSTRLRHAWRSTGGAALLVVLAGCAGAAGDRQVRSEVTADSSSGTQSDRPAEVASSNGDGWHNVFAHSINDAGVIAGAVRRSNYHGCAVIWESGAARPLVRPSGRISSSASDINNAGTVTGSTTVPHGKNGGANNLASLWSGGDVQELRVSGGETSNGKAINARGHIAGTYRRAGGNSRAFLWDGSRIQDLGDSPHPEFARVFATDINDHGAIVGYLLPVQGESFQAIRILGSDAFIWQNGVMRKLLPDADLIDFEAKSINNAGDVVGSMMPRNPEREVGFVLSGGKLHELAPPQGWRQSDAAAINDRGQIVGSAVDSISRLHAVLWEGGRLRVLGKLPGDIHSRATSINARGQVVGYSEGAGERTRAFLWENGTMRELLPPAPGDPRCRRPASRDAR